MARCLAVTLLLASVAASHALAMAANRRRTSIADNTQNAAQAHPAFSTSPDLGAGLADDLWAGLTRERMLAMVNKCEGGCSVGHEALRMCLRAPVDSQRVIIATFILPKLGHTSPPRLRPVAFAEALVDLAVQAACSGRPRLLEACVAELKQLAALAHDIVARRSDADDAELAAFTAALTPVLAVAREAAAPCEPPDARCSSTVAAAAASAIPPGSS